MSGLGLTNGDDLVEMAFVDQEIPLLEYGQTRKGLEALSKSTILV